MVLKSTFMSCVIIQIKLTHYINTVHSLDYEMHAYPESLAVLKYWHERCNIAVASRTTYPEGGEMCLKLFGFDKYIDHKEIYPGCKLQHFESLQRKTGFTYKEMLFFDDEPRNIRDLKRQGVECVLVDENIGVTMKMVENAVKKFTNVARI